MWMILLSVAVLGTWVVFCVYMACTRDNSYTGEQWGFFGGCFGSPGLAMILFFLSLFVIPATTGMGEGFSKGELIGHVTEVSCEGVFWKTTEAWVSLTIEPGVAYQKPLKVSVPDLALWNEIAKRVGQKVHLRYKGWLIMPFRLGATNYEIVGME